MANQRFSRRFQTFFKVVLNVSEPDERYGVTEYSEAVEIRRPLVHLPNKDILSTHRLCLEHEETIAPHHADQLHEVLAELKLTQGVDRKFVIGRSGSQGLEF